MKGTDSSNNRTREETCDHCDGGGKIQCPHYYWFVDKCVELDRSGDVVREVPEEECPEGGWDNCDEGYIECEPCEGKGFIVKPV